MCLNLASISLFPGAWHCLTHTVETKGVLSLYKGLSSPLLGSMAENALLFWAYNHCKRFLVQVNDNDEKLSLFQLSLAGAGAGAVVPFVLTPVELVKCRLQVQNHGGAGSFRVYKGPIDVIVQTVRTEGIARGLYRGHGSTLLREIPGNFVWYGLYEGVCMSMIPEGGTKDDLGASVHLLGGGKDSYSVVVWCTLPCVNFVSDALLKLASSATFSACRSGILDGLLSCRHCQIHDSDQPRSHGKRICGNFFVYLQDGGCARALSGMGYNCCTCGSCPCCHFRRLRAHHEIAQENG